MCVLLTIHHSLYMHKGALTYTFTSLSALQQFRKLNAKLFQIKAKKEPSLLYKKIGKQTRWGK